MPKSFKLNAFSRPILASIVALSAIVPQAVRAEETPYLQVADFDDVMALPAEARSNYIALLRDTLVKMAENDEGTDHEFFGGNDLNAPIVMNGWRGGYYAIVRAFIGEANADVKFQWPVVITSKDAYEEYLAKRAYVANEEPYGAGRNSSTINWANDRNKRLLNLDNEYREQAAKATVIDAKERLTPQEYAKQKASIEKLLRDNPNAGTTWTNSVKGSLEALEKRYAVEQARPKNGEKNDCPTAHAALKSCFVPIKDDVYGFKARYKACRDQGGMMAYDGGTLTSRKTAQCMTQAYFEAKKKEGFEDAGTSDDQREYGLETISKNLCASPNVKCGKVTKAQREEFAKVNNNACINAGNVSEYVNKNGTEKKEIRRGKCAGPRTVSYGPVTVSCESSDANVVLCNPLIFDTLDEVPDKLPTDGKKIELKGRCVPRTNHATRACNKEFNAANPKNAVGPKKHFWDSQVPGVQEKFKELAGVMNRTCGDSRARGIQCEECGIMQGNLQASKAFLKACPTANNAPIKNPPKPPKRPGNVTT